MRVSVRVSVCACVSVPVCLSGRLAVCLCVSAFLSVVRVCLYVSVRTCVSLSVCVAVGPCVCLCLCPSVCVCNGHDLLSHVHRSYPCMHNGDSNHTRTPMCAHIYIRIIMQTCKQEKLLALSPSTTRPHHEARNVRHLHP